MSKVLILAEGQTEETFIKNVLAPYLLEKGIYHVAAKVATTKRMKGGPDFKGGIVSFGKVKNDIERLLQDTSASLVTTFIDFYGLPTDFPQIRNIPTGSCYDQVSFLEEAFGQHINNPKFLPYLSLHEFEALLFIDPELTANAFPDKNKSKELAAIQTQFKSPEEINNGPETAPSKRLQKLFPAYQKTLHGPLITLEIGIERIRSQCPHFNQWLGKLESL